MSDIKVIRSRSRVIISGQSFRGNLWLATNAADAEVIVNVSLETAEEYIQIVKEAGLNIEEK